MVLVVNKKTDKILNRCDAWLEGAEGKMIGWAKENGFTPISSEITFMGDMVIWVE